jgi:hypothetical protein
VDKGGGANDMTGGNFRFRADDDTQDPFTDGWIAALNANLTLYLNADNFRLRYGIHRTSATAQSHQLVMAYSKNGVGYAQILDDGTTPLTNVSSTHCTNNEDIIEYAGAHRTAEPGFLWGDLTNGYMITDDAQSDTAVADWTGNQTLSMEICLKIEPTLLVGGDYVEFRPYQDGMLLLDGGWDHTARIDFLGMYHEWMNVPIRQRSLNRILTR